MVYSKTVGWRIALNDFITDDLQDESTANQVFTEKVNAFIESGMGFKLELLEVVRGIDSAAEGELKYEL